jgi:hypothetical protein
MELNSNSINARLYRWFYHKNTNQMPKSLCPYFWQLLIMYVFIVPYTLIALPYHLFNNWKNESFVSGIVGSLVVYLFLFGIFTMVTFIVFLFIKLPEKSGWVHICVGGAVFWFFTIGILLVNFFEYLWEKPKGSLREKKPNIIAEFIKAKYNRYCPKITWK